MYILVKISSYLIRQFYLPNPFSNLFTSPGKAELANWAFGGALILFAYVLTGIWYDGENKVLGSFGFLLNYTLLSGLLLFITKFITNFYIVGILFFVGYIILCIIENKLFNEEFSF